MLMSLTQHAVGGKRTPLQLLVPGTASLKSRYRAGFATTSSGAMQAFGASGTPPAVTITATVFVKTLPVEIQMTKTGARGTAEFRISENGGKTWLEGQLTAASYGTPSGETVTFAVGTYNVDYRYSRVIADCTSVVGSTTCTASGSARMQSNSANGHFGAFLDGAADFLTAAGVDASSASGNDKPFTIVLVASLTSISATATGVQPLVGFARNVVSSNPVHHFSVRGPLGTPANNFASTRTDDGGTSVAVNTGSPAPDVNLHVYVIRFTGTALTVTRDGTAIFSGSAQNVGNATFDNLTFGGLRRFLVAAALSALRLTDWAVYSADVGATAATILTNMYLTRYQVRAKSQVKRLICLCVGGQSNGQGIIGTFMPAPPPGSPWTQIMMLRRQLVGTGLISDTVLQQLNFTAVGAGSYHGPGMQTAIDLWFAGYDVFLLIITAAGSYLTDWIGAGTYSAAFDTAISDANTLLAVEYPNATREWHFLWDQCEAEAKDASATPANNWVGNVGSYPTPAAGTLLKKVNDATGQSMRPRFMKAQTQLNVAPSAAPQLAQMRTNAGTAATNANGFSLDWDSLATQTQYLMADNTHATGRCQNYRGSLWSASLLANELAP